MEMTGEYRIPASRDEVWRALNDPEILRQSIPGCEEIEKLSDTEMKAAVTAKVGPVKAKFSGTVTLSDIDPPKAYRISGEGSGGAAGFAKGGARVTLDEDGAETLLRYTVEASVGGKLAQIGSRLVDSAARKIAGDFFENFNAIMSGAPQEGAAEAPPTLEEAALEEQTVDQAYELEIAPEAGRRLGPVLWAGAVIAFVVALLAFFAVG